jgi:hypothetical protein
MAIDEILVKLQSTKSDERRKSAKEIGRQKITGLGEALFNAYCKEERDSRTWETKVEMILALGLIDYKQAICKIDEIVDKNKPHDMITYAAAQTYVRLKRKFLNDAEPVIELTKFGGLSVVSGALHAITFDKMLPANTEIIELLELGWNLHKHKDRIGHENGYLDPRCYLASACAGWDKQLTRPFLNYCLETAGKDATLKKAVEYAIKGKYIY